MARDRYRAYILLSLFEKNDVTRSAQVYNILQGKRTGSTLYQALLNHYLPFYGLYPDWQRAEFDSLVSSFESKELIKDIGKNEYLLLDKGRQACSFYFKEYHYPQYLNNIRYSKLFPSFWAVIQLLTQIFSEKSYNNKFYNPIIQNLEDQYFAKKWLKIAEQKGWTSSRFYKEWVILLSHMEKEEADLIAQLLTGHDLIGKTKDQVRKERNLEAEEFDLYLREIWHRAFDWIRNNDEQVSIFYDVLSRTDWASHKGLSQTTWTTFTYIMKNRPIKEIAEIRKIKENTVGDHVIEIGIVLPEFPLQKLVSPLNQRIILQFIEDHPEKRYRDFQEVYTDVPFYEYRFMEILRWRETYDTPIE